MRDFIDEERAQAEKVAKKLLNPKPKLYPENVSLYDTTLFMSMSMNLYSTAPRLSAIISGFNGV